MRPPRTNRNFHVEKGQLPEGSWDWARKEEADKEVMMMIQIQTDDSVLKIPAAEGLQSFKEWALKQTHHLQKRVVSCRTYLTKQN